jgi:hypothetical protein
VAEARVELAERVFIPSGGVDRDVYASCASVLVARLLDDLPLAGRAVLLPASDGVGAAYAWERPALGVALEAKDAAYAAEWLNVMGGPSDPAAKRAHLARLCRIRRALKGDTIPCAVYGCCANVDDD